MKKDVSKATKQRFAQTGEPKVAPTLDDAVAERKLTARSTGGRAKHSGAFSKLESVPPMIGTKK